MAAGDWEAGNEVVKQKYETWKRNGNGSSWGNIMEKEVQKRLRQKEKKRGRREEGM